MKNENKGNQTKGVARMTTKVQKWGGSLGVRLPKHVAEQFGVENGSRVEVVPSDEGIYVKPIEVYEPTLEELMAQITEDNQHEEIDFGQSEGNEKW